MLQFSLSKIRIILKLTNSLKLSWVAKNYLLTPLLTLLWMWNVQFVLSLMNWAKLEFPWTFLLRTPQSHNSLREKISNRRWFWLFPGQKVLWEKLATQYESRGILCSLQRPQAMLTLPGAEGDQPRYVVSQTHKYTNTQIQKRNWRLHILEQEYFVFFFSLCKRDLFSRRIYYLRENLNIFIECFLTENMESERNGKLD